MVSVDREKTGSPPCVLLEWDTAFFGVRIGRVATASLDAAALQAALAWRAEQQVRGLTCLVDAGDPDAVHLLERNGFLLADVRLTLARDIAGSDGDLDSGAGPVRRARADDAPPLAEIAARSHTGTRYTADPHFRPHAERFYRKWVERSFEGFADEVLVAEHDGRAVGYLSVKMERAGIGNIGLVGVAESARRLGVGTSLLRHGVAWFAKRDVVEATVVTQGSNIAAQRLFQGAGFRSRGVELWFHRWWD